ncbi:conserved membrane protein, unknown function [Hepatocystis sp. ex Piliocolobus tephrosceles]|nr:conserved membrane protein, unknown function [Hepatocystis sp. ex Piliocolobus tephrosceles]
MSAGPAFNRGIRDHKLEEKTCRKYGDSFIGLKYNSYLNKNKNNSYLNKNKLLLKKIKNKKLTQGDKLTQSDKHLWKSFWIYNTEEYNLIFLHLYMLLFILKKNKIKNKKIYEQVIFFVINECLKNFIKIYDHLNKKESNERDNSEHGHNINEKKIIFFNYIFEQIIVFTINANSYKISDKICRKLLHQYKDININIMKLPLIVLLKNITDLYIFSISNYKITNNKIKEQMNIYTCEKKKGVVINSQIDHTHPFNVQLCSTLTNQNKKKKNHNVVNYSYSNRTVCINKCEHNYHYACIKKCTLCDEFKKKHKK